MTKRINAKKKISRKLGVSLWGHAKDPFLKKNFKPGQHGAGLRSRNSDYSNQLKAKQKMKFYYGNISEKQFSNTFALAKKTRGDVSENFIGLLESRIDIIIYRANFVPTVFAARQFISHKHVVVNGKVVNIASYQLKPGDTVGIREKSKSLEVIVDSLHGKNANRWNWLEWNGKELEGKFLTYPDRDQVPENIKEQLIVELYSK